MGSSEGQVTENRISNILRMRKSETPFVEFSDLECSLSSQAGILAFWALFFNCRENMFGVESLSKNQVSPAILLWNPLIFMMCVFVTTFFCLFPKPGS
jgi:hypothetical protein